MKTGRNLQEVLVELNRQNQAKQDFISPAQGMHLREDGHTFEINHLTTNQQEVFGTTSLFHRQVASALGIPAKYYDLMQKEKPELLAENVNSWFADKPSSYMVRSMDYGAGQVARALLSERYRRIDNMEIATAVLPLFAGNDQYEVMSCEVTENRLYLKVVNHRLEMEVRKGDIVQAGVMISNSEVGLGAVSIQPLVYRLVCTNGMVVNDMGERRHHVGRQAKAVEDSFTLYSDETMEAEDKAFLLKLRDTTMAAIDEARFSQVVGRLQESMAVPITGRVQDVVQLTAQSYGINAEEQEGILKYLIEGGDLSLWPVQRSHPHIAGCRFLRPCHYTGGHRLAGRHDGAAAVEADQSVMGRESSCRKKHRLSVGSIIKKKRCRNVAITEVILIRLQMRLSGM